MQLSKAIYMDYISGWDRNQMQFFVLGEMVAEDSWARTIDIFVMPRGTTCELAPVYKGGKAPGNDRSG